MIKQNINWCSFIRTATSTSALVVALALTSAPRNSQAQTPAPTGPHPVIDQKHVPLVCGEVLSGTAGTATGARRPVAKDATETGFAKWWDGPTMLSGSGNPLFDFRSAASDNGVTFSGSYQGAFFGVIDSQGGSRGFWDQQINFSSDINLGKLLKVEALEGSMIFGAFRYRDSSRTSDPNQFVQANSMFNPSGYQSGTQFRVLCFGMEVSTAGLLPVKDMITLRAGWLQPQREFLDQPLSKLFMDSAISAGKGLGGNIPFSSSFSTWGSSLKIKLVEEYYIKGALYMAYPQATSSTNHGLAYSGFGPDTSLNGLFAIAETGYTPKLGPQELPGRYAFGGYYWGNEKVSYSGTETPGQYGFYFQADQMVYREPSTQTEPAPATAAAAPDGKSFKAPVAAEKPKLSKQGLSLFNMLTFAPGYNNTFPFYFQSGLVYTGLIPGRNKDLTMMVLGYGAYQSLDVPNARSYTAVLEGGYRFQINGWSYLQPFAQYVIRPAGNSTVQNAAILGFNVGLVF